ncbi:MAG: AEC family transporter [Chromatiaceae bacterium]|nr:AEC family transporter [Gammaproteobacteria bacterium]MCP5301085.1 AEC family transporter [Chromatiaceae bacterium]MCP5421443.1 AEC family transporter [Chromatiaceae bacterium]
MSQVFNIVFPIFAIVLLGYLYARRFGPDMASANRLNIEIFTPALIFSVLSAEGFELARYAELALAGVIVVLGSGLVAWPVTRLLHLRPKVFLPPMMFNNSGNMGLPLALFAFGEAALPAAMVLFLVENTLHFTVGNAMLTGHVNPLRLLRLPMLIATLAGIAVAATGFQVPGPLHEAIDLLGQIAIPLMLFALGVRMTDVDLSDWRIGVAGAVVCPLSGLVMAWLALHVVTLPGIQPAQLLVFAALPPAVLNFMLAERYAVEPHKVAAMVLLGNLASLLVIPGVLYAVL